ncbi:MAG TPA: hypothetical protein VKA38_01295 [Draconibacterium sp.]|nr:hypothetical protein [Draconibacterium sp.]
MNKTISFLTIVSVLLFSIPVTIWSAGQEDKLAKAVQLFESKKYEEAEPVFRQLLDKQPENPMLNYYYGSCQTENGMFSTSVLNYLLKAGEGEVPVKVDYYLGIQYQAQNKWEQALRHYNKFRIKMQKTEQDELKLAEKIQQCYNHENPFFTSNVTESQTNKTTATSKNDSLTAGNTITHRAKDTLQNNFSEPDSLNMEEDLAPGMPIEFIINSEITYWNTSNFKTEEAKKIFMEANSKQQELDSGLQKAKELREDYPKATSESEKKIIGEEILSLENETFKLKDEITQLLERSRNLENAYWQSAQEQELADFKAESKKIAQMVSSPEPKEDSAKALPDSNLIVDPNILLNKLEIKNVKPKQPETDELVYKIQIGAYSKGLPRYVDKLFKKLSLIRKIDHYTDEKGVTVYTTGNLTNLGDAIKMQNQVRQEGVEDAFVVPYFNGKRITLKQAKEMTNEL